MPARSATQGGDWCEAFPLSEDVVALSIGDVRGHGAGSFTTMLTLRDAVRRAAQRGLDPNRVITEANRFLRTFDPNMQATAVFALLDTRTLTMTFANAGHPPPLMIGAGGPLFLQFPISDMPLGITAALSPVLRSVELPPDALLVLYTDGVTEHACRPLAGEAELREAALFTHRHSGLPSAGVIERQMFLTGSNRDDAAILTAWTPRLPLYAVRMRNAAKRPLSASRRRLNLPQLVAVADPVQP